MEDSTEQYELDVIEEEVGEELEEFTFEEELDKDKLASRSAGSWADHTFVCDWTEEEKELSDDVDDIPVKFRATSCDNFFGHIKKGSDDKSHINETHGYTFIDTIEVDAAGRQKVVRAFVPRIRQVIRSYKKLVKVTVTFTNVENDSNIVQEEEDLNEEMEVDEVTNTVLIQRTDAEGNTIVEEMQVVQEIVKNPDKPGKFIKLKMINDEGNPVVEVVELNDDEGRTEDIMRLAEPYMKKQRPKKLGILSEKECEAQRESSALADWQKIRDNASQMELKTIVALKQALDEQKFLKEMNKYLGKELCRYYDLKGRADPNFDYKEGIPDTDEEKEAYLERVRTLGDVLNYTFREDAKRSHLISQVEADVKKEIDHLNALRKMFYDLEETLYKGLNPMDCNLNHSLSFHELISQQKLMDNSLSKVGFEFVKSELTTQALKGRIQEMKDRIYRMETVDFINCKNLKRRNKRLIETLDFKEKQVLSYNDTMTHRVQALAHLRLKIKHMTVENGKLKKETEGIAKELKTLRKDSLRTQLERRRLEKKLFKITSKEGLAKYPYLMNDYETLTSKHDEQVAFLSDLFNTCKELKGEVQEKCKERQEGVKKYRALKETRRQNPQLSSFYMN